MEQPQQESFIPVSAISALRPPLLELAEEHGTPLYVYDPQHTLANLQRFQRAFASAGREVGIFYALKSNPYPGLLSTVVAAGGGLDASSPRELKLALRAGARKIVFTGPGKSHADLELVLKHRRRVVVHLESLRELIDLGQLAAAQQVEVRCGLRLATRHQQRWNKFGIPLSDLQRCWRAARRHPQLKLVALHFHGGTLDRPDPVVGTLQDIAIQLRASGQRDAIEALEFLDVGGGIVPRALEGIYPWNREQSMSFDRDPELLQRILRDEIQPHFEVADVTPVETFATAIADAFREHIAPLNPTMTLCAEPGKFISHSAMHLLFRVTELKGPQAVIVDGGTNMIGWEKYEYFDYAPIFNLTHYAPRKERPVLVYGNLCTPHDLWGYYVRGRTLRRGDLLCMPFQGAYTYTLAQSFIRPIPPVVDLHP